MTLKKPPLTRRKSPKKGLMQRTMKRKASMTMKKTVKMMTTKMTPSTLTKTGKTSRKKKGNSRNLMDKNRKT